MENAASTPAAAPLSWWIRTPTWTPPTLMWTATPCWHAPAQLVSRSFWLLAAVRKRWIPHAYAERHDWIYAAAGIHPHEAQLATPAHYETLSRLAQHPRFLAWGEIGLDYHYDHSPRNVQQRVLAEQLELARAARKPVILHCREAWPDCLALLERHWRASGLGGIFHCLGARWRRRGRE